MEAEIKKKHKFASKYLPKLYQAKKNDEKWINLVWSDRKNIKDAFEIKQAAIIADDVRALYAKPKEVSSLEKQAILANLAEITNERTHCIIDYADTLYTYSGKYYEEQEGNLTSRYAGLIRSTWGKEVTKLLNKEHRGKLAEYAKDSCTIKADEFDKSGLICAQNGMILISAKSVKLLPHNHEYLAQIYLDIKYDPKQTCHRFESYLEDMSRDTDGTVRPTVVKRLWEVVALAINPKRGLQKAHMLYGLGKNGKGVLINVLRLMLGTTNYSDITIKSLTSRYSKITNIIPPMYRKLANFDDDMSAAKWEDDSIIKSLWGGALTIGMERKYKETINVSIDATQIMALNTIPKFERSTGIIRKLNVIHLKYKVPTEKRITDFENILIEEKEGIFSKAIQIRQEIEKRGSLEYEQSEDEIIQILADNTTDEIEQTVHALFEPTKIISEMLSAQDIVIECKSYLERNYAYSDSMLEKITIRWLNRYPPILKSQIRKSGGVLYGVRFKGLEPQQRTINETN